MPPLACALTAALLFTACRSTPDSAAAWTTLARQLEAADARAEDTDGPDLHRAATEGLRDALTLRVGSTTHRATSVYTCHQLEAQGDEPARRCRSWFADDTIHTTEFPPFDTVNVPIEGARIETLAGLELIAVEAGAPGPMHDSGYRDVTALAPTREGVVQMPSNTPSTQPTLLWLIARLPATDAKPGRIAKWVWVVSTP